MSDCCGPRRCTCQILAGTGVTADGRGSAGAPYVISSTPALPEVGCGLTGGGTAASPLAVAPTGGQEAWPWDCDAAATSTLCDPVTGELWTPPEHYSAVDQVYLDHFPAGLETPLGPSGWTILASNAWAAFDIPPNFLGNLCRPWNYAVTCSGVWDLSWTATATFELGYALSWNSDSCPFTYRPCVGAAHPLRHRALGAEQRGGQ